LPMKVRCFNQIHIVYFISKGQVGFVLPRYITKIYRIFDEGSHFGHLEFIESTVLFDGGDFAPDTPQTSGLLTSRRMSVHSNFSQ